jgi:hypothetical protein
MTENFKKQMIYIKPQIQEVQRIPSRILDYLKIHTWRSKTKDEEE